MDINPTSYNSNIASLLDYTNPASTAAAASAEESGQTQNTGLIEDIFEKSSETQTYKPDYAKVQQMLKETDPKVEAFRELVRKLLMKQGDTAQKAGMTSMDELEIFGKGMVEIDDETRAAAEELISEDGYYGVKKTSERLLEFAKALTGGDPSKVELMRDAVTQGFKEAEEQWGGKLPEITQKTYDATMKLFDEWAAEGKTGETTQK